MHIKEKFNNLYQKQEELHNMILLLKSRSTPLITEEIQAILTQLTLMSYDCMKLNKHLFNKSKKEALDIINSLSLNLIHITDNINPNLTSFIKIEDIITKLGYLIQQHSNYIYDNNKLSAENNIEFLKNIMQKIDKLALTIDMDTREVTKNK